MPEFIEKALNQINTKSSTWVGLREVREKTTVRYIRDQKPQSNDSSESHGLMIEVLHRGQFAYAATSQLTLKAVQEAYEKAKLLAEQAAQHKIFSFSANQRPPVQVKYNSPVLKNLSLMSASDINELLIKISQTLKISDKIIRTSAAFVTTETETHFVSSNGSNAHQQFTFVATDFGATAQDGPIVQKRTDNGFRARCYQGGLEYLVTDDLWQRVDQIAQQALELLSAEQCPTETCDLILMPDQMMLQIHESVGHPLELDRILGDERNYAGWSFVKLEDFGKLQYGSKLMNITFDPSRQSQFASYACDDIGNKAEKKFLIKDGLLLLGLGSLESQARTQMEGVANQRASLWNRAPIDRMANLNLEPGTASLSEMISSVKRGVLMESNRSWSIDDFRNKFQFGCEYAKLIENGKLTKTLRNPNYRGVSVPFWKSLKTLGNTSTLRAYGTPYCGKGEPNQAIRVGHASPACLFENIEVFGGDGQ